MLRFSSATETATEADTATFTVTETDNVTKTSTITNTVIQATTVTQGVNTSIAFLVCAPTNYANVVINGGFESGNMSPYFNLQ
jgi:formylmethanofuran dehydrogenase subunit D